MHSLVRFPAVFALLVLPGCTEVTSPTTAPLELNVSSVDVPMGEPVPLEGARLCQTGTKTCDFTNANGGVSIDLPIAKETSITLEKDGHASYLVPVFIRSVNGVDNPFEMATNEHMVAQFGRLDSRYPMLGTGAIVIVVFPHSEGATFELVNATGQKAFYTDEGGFWSLDLTEATGGGQPRQVRGGFVEVTPGDEYQVRVGGAVHDCRPSWGWPSDDQENFKVPVREDYLTNLRLTCRPL